MITVRRQDLLKGTPIPDGWYDLKVVKCPERPTKPKSGGDSLNFNYTFAVCKNGEIDDNMPEIDHNFNSAAMGLMRDFIAICKGITVKELLSDPRIQFDETTEPMEKTMQCKIVNETFEGRIISKIKGWLPIGVTPPF